MRSIVLKATAKTPRIDFNPDRGILEISGRSTPEDSRVFYKPLITWCEEYASNPPDKTTLDVNLVHFDTSSSKGLLDFLKRLKTIREKNKEVTVIWHYEMSDPDILEAGQNFKHITGLPFKMTPH
jgi:hypothetical protein